MDILPISEMPNLMKRLGKSGTDRIRAANTDMSSYRSTRHTFKNTVIQEMQCRHSGQRGEVSDIINGVAQNNDGGDKPLNAARLYVIFQCLENIDSRRVSRICDLGPKQASQYVRACRIALPYLEKYFNKDYDNDPIINEGDFFAL